MPVESFTKQHFEDALPIGQDNYPLWRHAGFDKGEHIYFVHPFPKIPYGILVRSSVGSNNTSKGNGEDSIRARIIKIENETLNYTVHGGLNQQHVKRTKGWEERMLKMLRKLAGQCQYCVPCPFCKEVLVPFTVEADNKKKAIIKCCSAQCRNGKYESRVLISTEDEKGNHLTPDNNREWKELRASVASKPTTQTPSVPQCNKCGANMKRMNTENGWRCAVTGNFYQGGKWSKCDFVIWDEGKGPKPKEEKQVPPGLTEIMFVGDGVKTNGDYNTLRKLVEEAWEELSQADDLPATFFGTGVSIKKLRDYLESHK